MTLDEKKADAISVSWDIFLYDARQLGYDRITPLEKTTLEAGTFGDASLQSAHDAHGTRTTEINSQASIEDLMAYWSTNHVDDGWQNALGS